MSRAPVFVSSLIVLLALAGEARAEFPERAPYVGVSGGYNLRLKDWQLGEWANQGSERPGLPESSPVFNLRLGYMVLKQLGVEANLGYLPVVSSVGDKLNHALKYELTALYHVLPGNYTPFVAAGVGLYQKLSASGGDLGPDIDAQYHFGIGARALLRPWVAARVELRDVISDGFNKWGSNNVEITAGLDFFVFSLLQAKAAVAQVLDRDGDGIADANDRCPDQKGSAATGGCPDSDNDGITDAEDRCPSQAGVAATAGCPDSDNDGVGDADDKCPTQAGKKELAGCADSDNDGVSDAEDKCPTQPGKKELAGCADGDNDGVSDAEDKCPVEAGPAATGGCPDKDGDGIGDVLDKCPDKAGAAATNGCPDRDGDGVADAEDKCPDKAGLKDQQGCLPKAVEKFTGSIKGITFDIGKATIAKSSNSTLDATAKLMQQYPSLKLRVEGHTDSDGHADDNKKLSQERADAVKAYLVSKGIDAGRLEAVGFGDTKPIADNKTEKGQAENRRIEFAVIQ